MADETTGAQASPEAPAGTDTPAATTTPATDTLLPAADDKGATDGKPADEGKPDTDDKTKDGAKDGDGKGDGDKPDAKADAIEYTDFTVPEGITIDEEKLGEFKPIAQELGLDQAQAQKLVDLYAGIEAKNHAAWAEQIGKWAEETRADPEIGGAKLTESMKDAQAAIVAFGGQELLDRINSSGLGCDPVTLRAWTKIGRALQEDKTLAPGAAAGRAVDPGKVLFDHPTSQQR